MVDINGIRNQINGVRNSVMNHSQGVRKDIRSIRAGGSGGAGANRGAIITMGFLTGDDENGNGNDSFIDKIKNKVAEIQDNLSAQRANFGFGAKTLQTRSPPRGSTLGKKMGPKPPQRGSTLN